MKISFPSRLSRMVVFCVMLFAAMSAGAESVTVETPGSLPDLLPSTATEATIVGSINGTDVKYLRQLINEEHLTSLDLSKTNFVSGGEAYYDGRHTQDGVLHEYMFYNCKNLKAIVLPTSITDINQWAFAYSGLTSIVIPDNITTIHYYAFSYCDNLNKVMIGEKMDYLGRGIFYKSNVQEVYVKTLTPSSIGDKCFSSSPIIHVFNSVETTYQATDWNGFGTLLGDLDGILPTLNLSEDIMFMGYFEDAACTRLKPEYAAMDDNELINKMKSDIIYDDLIEIALKIKNSDWAPYEKDFRIHDYGIYSDPTYWHGKLNCTGGSFMGNPTGIYSATDDTIYVFVEQDIPSDAILYLAGRVGNDMIKRARTGTKLHKGLNIVSGQKDALYYILYTDNTATAMTKKVSEFPKMKIHIEGGVVNGYYDNARHDNEAYQAILNNATHELFTVKGTYSVFNFKTETYRTTWPEEIERSISWFDSLIVWQKDLMGITKFVAEGTRAQAPFYLTGGDAIFPDYFNNPGFAIEGNSTDAGMANAGNFRTSYNSPKYVASSFNVYADRFDEWCASHEVGHNNQLAIRLRGTGEVSNNLFSNMMCFLDGRRCTAGEPLSTTFDDYCKRKPYPYRDIWSMTRMYFQLYLYYHQAQRMISFYPTLFQELRKDPLSGSVMNNNQLKFVRKVCEITNEDLTDFFSAWGFFEPMDSTYVLNQADIDATMEEISKYPRKNREILFIEDRVQYMQTTDFVTTPGQNRKKSDQVGKCGDLGQFTDYLPEKKTIPSYTYSQLDSLIELFGNGGVGFIVYDENGKLLFASNNKRFVLPTSVMTQNYTIYAVDADGNLYEIPKNEKSSVDVTMEEAGTLCDKLDQYTIYAKISGPINGTDIKCIRDYINEGSLMSLDLSDALIVSGGEAYYDGRYTQDGIIHEYMFYKCENLKTIVLPTGITDINQWAFSYSGLISIVIPDSVTTIHYNAFSHCKSLETVYIGENIDYLGRYIFYHSNVENVYVDALVPSSIGSEAFTSKPILHVKNEAVADYRASDWAKFGTIEEMYHEFGVWDTLQPATCTESGFRHRLCIHDSCGVLEEDSILAYGHTEEIIPAVEATCTHDGFSQGLRCSVCGLVIFEQDTIPALDHEFGAWDTLLPATCTEAGFRHRLCARDGCGVLEEDSIIAYGHTEEIISAVAATCTLDGLSEGLRCSVCGLVIFEQDTIPALDHEFGAWDTIQPATCTESGFRHRLCIHDSCGVLEEDSILAYGHTEEIIPAVEATCTHDGLSEGLRCSVCGLVIFEQDTIPALDHEFGVWDTIQPATDTETGLLRRVCVRDSCDVYEETIIPMTGKTGLSAANLPTIELYAVDKNVYVRNAEEKDVFVYNIMGSLVCQIHAKSNLESLGVLSSGVYLVGVEGKHFKVVVK